MAQEMGEAVACQGTSTAAHVGADKDSDKCSAKIVQR